MHHLETADIILITFISFDI